MQSFWAQVLLFDRIDHTFANDSEIGIGDLFQCRDMQLNCNRIQIRTLTLNTAQVMR